ncbi:MAG: hypothetical protein R6V50_02680 [Thermoplasmatota archaeon]
MVKIGAAIAGASALPVFAVVLLSDYWIPALLGTEYVVYRNVFAAYLVWQAFTASLVTVDPLFVAAGHVRSKFFITAASNVAYMFMAVPLVSALGLWGIVIAAIAQGCLILVPKLLVLGRKKT